MKRQIKKAASILLALTIALSAMLGTVVTAGAATYDSASASKNDISINATEVTIYAIDEWAEEYISIPSEYDTSFQLSVSGAEKVTYKLPGLPGADISSDGLITPKVTTFYWYGNYGVSEPEPDKTPVRITKNVSFGETEIIVCADDETFEVKINVVDYADVYAEMVMDDYLAENISDDIDYIRKA